MAVTGREQGVRLIEIADPCHFDVGRDGGYDGFLLSPNCTIDCDRVQLERLTPQTPDDAANMHLVLGGEAEGSYRDGRSLYPVIRFTECDNVAACLGNSVASAHFERCLVNTVSAPGLRGELTFTTCRLRPEIGQSPTAYYAVDSTLGTRFTNCTVHAPVVSGEARPEEVSQMGFLAINGPVRHYHVNTAVGREVLEYLSQIGVRLETEFAIRLRSHHDLED